MNKIMIDKDEKDFYRGLVGACERHWGGTNHKTCN